jgi:hypothetical protein
MFAAGWCASTVFALILYKCIQEEGKFTLGDVLGIMWALLLSIANIFAALK